MDRSEWTCDRMRVFVEERRDNNQNIRKYTKCDPLPYKLTLLVCTILVLIQMENPQMED